MTDLIAQFFVAPMALSGVQKAVLILPLCLSISIIYKATRLTRVRDIPRAALHLWVTIVAGMYGVGVLLWFVYHLMI